MNYTVCLCAHCCWKRRHPMNDMQFGLLCWAIGIGFGWVGCLVWFK